LTKISGALFRIFWNFLASFTYYSWAIKKEARSFVIPGSSFPSDMIDWYVEIWNVLYKTN